MNNLKKKLNEIEYDVLDSRLFVYIKTNGDKIELKFSKFIEQFNEYLEFKGSPLNDAFTSPMNAN